MQPWAKAYPLCRPPEPNNKEDARRFAREFPEACGEVDADKDHVAREEGMSPLMRAGFAHPRLSERRIGVVIRVSPHIYA